MKILDIEPKYITRPIAKKLCKNKYLLRKYLLKYELIDNEYLLKKQKININSQTYFKNDKNNNNQMGGAGLGLLNLNAHEPESIFITKLAGKNLSEFEGLNKKDSNTRTALKDKLYSLSEKDEDINLMNTDMFNKFISLLTNISENTKATDLQKLRNSIIEEKIPQIITGINLKISTQSNSFNYLQYLQYLHYLHERNQNGLEGYLRKTYVPNELMNSQQDIINKFMKNLNIYIEEQHDEYKHILSSEKYNNNNKNKQIFKQFIKNYISKHDFEPDTTLLYINELFVFNNNCTATTSNDDEYMSINITINGNSRTFTKVNITFIDDIVLYHNDQIYIYCMVKSLDKSLETPVLSKVECLEEYKYQIHNNDLSQTITIWHVLAPSISTIMNFHLNYICTDYTIPNNNPHQNSFVKALFNPKNHIKVKFIYSFDTIVIDISKTEQYMLVKTGKPIYESPYTVVALYQEPVRNLKLCIKLERFVPNPDSDKSNTRPSEEEISKMLLTSGTEYCNAVYTRLIANQELKPLIYKYKYEETEWFMYIMKPLDGDLEQIFDNNTPIPKQFIPLNNEFNKLQIAESIRKQILCIYKVNPKFIYTDMKLANVLYCQIPDEQNYQIRIHLGDLGGAAYDSDGEYTSTYPPFEHNRISFFKIEPDEVNQILSWSIGILLFSIIGKPATNKLNRYMKYIETSKRVDGKKNFDNESKLQSKINKMMDNYYQTNPSAKLYLSFNPKERPDIYKSII